jgi:hypothetical protein
VVGQCQRSPCGEMLGVSAGVADVGQDLSKHSPTQRAVGRVGDDVIWHEAGSLDDRDTAASAPGVVVSADQVAEDPAADVAEDAPRGVEVCGGITETRGAEVDDSAKAPVLNEQVRRHQIAVDPGVGPIPCRATQGVFPGGRYRRAIDKVPGLRDPVADVRIVLGQGRTPP